MGKKSFIPLSMEQMKTIKSAVIWWLAFVTTIGISSVVYSWYVSSYPATASSGATLSSSEWNKMVAALQSLDTALTATSQAQAWSAESTGLVPSSNTSWMTIPGLSVTFTLKKSAKVQLTGNGIQRAVGPTWTCHVGYRFMVNGTGRWEATHWQRIVTSDSATAWHAPFTIIGSENLPAGTHTIQVQAKDALNKCNICWESNGTVQQYDGCNFNVAAFYD